MLVANSLGDRGQRLPALFFLWVCQGLRCPTAQEASYTRCAETQPVGGWKMCDKKGAKRPSLAWERGILGIMVQKPPKSSIINHP